jgi:hypothetical protein
MNEMTDRRRGIRWLQRVLVALVLLLVLVPTGGGAFAADTRQGDVVTVGAGQTINDDLYAFGGTVDIQGRINGDVVASGGTVTIHGQGSVTGDLLAAGGTTTVRGRSAARYAPQAVPSRSTVPLARTWLWRGAR